jgi:hypothetical protein
MPEYTEEQIREIKKAAWAEGYAAPISAERASNPYAKPPLPSLEEALKTIHHGDTRLTIRIIQDLLRAAASMRDAGKLQVGRTIAQVCWDDALAEAGIRP